MLPNTVAVGLLDWNLWVLAAYRPPSYGQAENTALIEAILDFCEGREVVILGDLNLLSLVWYRDADLFRQACPMNRLFLDCLVSAGLTQWVMEGTFVSSGNVLELFLTSEIDRVGSVEVLAHFPSVCTHLLLLNIFLVEVLEWMKICSRSSCGIGATIVLK